MIKPDSPLEKVILESLLKHAKDMCFTSEGTIQNLAYYVCEDCKKAAEKDDSLYLELYK